MLVLKCQVLPFSRALTLLAYCLGLRGACPVATLPGVFLAPFYQVCGGGAGTGLPFGPARLDISLLQSWCLVLGPGFLVCRLHSVSLPWAGSVRRFVYVSTF